MPEHADSLLADRKIRTLVRVVLAVLAAYLLVISIGELKQLRFIGSGVSATNTINVSGEGEVFAVPDTATFTATVQETAKDVKTAQDAAAKKANDIIAYLKSAGVAEADVQTTDYSIYPQYDYTRPACPVSTDGTYVPCPPGKQVLTGYQVSETLTVKVRDTSKAGDLLSGVGGKGVSNISGLSLTVSNQDQLEAQARDKAISQAKDKADALAKSLGVSIVRVVGFSENGNYPVYYAKTMAVGMGASDAAAPAPEIATGQNKITSNVSITYEIQ
jgi:uncharacterized protein YggE